jgi:NAD+ kinase
MMSNQRRVLLVVHPTREDARDYAIGLSDQLIARGYEVVSNFPALVPSASPIDTLDGVEIAIVLGGDGTILRAAELCRGRSIPVLGINLGSVGFLAEIQKPTYEEILHAISAKSYVSETRLVVQYDVVRGDKVVDSGWAINEVVIEGNPGQMIQLLVEIDGRPLSRWGCDGVICATPTGSTAYAFSAGGPVLWPEVEALVLLPIAAHALFSRPMVVSPSSKISIELESSAALLSTDGIRHTNLAAGDRVVITRDSHSVLLAHVENSLFTDRLVAKFKLPVEGWRG